MRVRGKGQYCCTPQDTHQEDFKGNYEVPQHLRLSDYGCWWEFCDPVAEVSRSEEAWQLWRNHRALTASYAVGLLFIFVGTLTWLRLIYAIVYLPYHSSLYDKSASSYYWKQVESQFLS